MTRKEPAAERRERSLKKKRDGPEDTRAIVNGTHQTKSSSVERIFERSPGGEFARTGELENSLDTQKDQMKLGTVTESHSKPGLREGKGNHWEETKLNTGKGKRLGSWLQSALTEQGWKSTNEVFRGKEEKK